MEKDECSYDGGEHIWSNWIYLYGSKSKAYKECKLCGARKFKLE